MKKRVIIIGAGVGGIATACILAQAGYDVHVYEKNSGPGGRAGSFEAKGFRFDMGPSWYLMTDVFEKFYEILGEDISKHLELVRLEPSYRVYFKDTLLGAVDIFGDIERDAHTFESLEPGARNKLRAYLEKSSANYERAMDRFVYKNYDSIFDFFSLSTIQDGLRANAFQSMQKYVAQYFSNTEVQKIVQFPLVFLGTNPSNAPALYNILSHVDFRQGTYYPQGGMYRVVESLVAMAEKRGATFHYDAAVSEIRAAGGIASGITLDSGETIEADYIVSNADLAHTETVLLKNQSDRTYPERYWKRRTLAPSAMLLYLGVKKRFPKLQHHNLVFCKDWDANFKSLSESKTWPADPSFYVCNPNKTDPSVAPKNKENLFVLIPLPANTRHTDQEAEAYADHILAVMEKTMHLDGLRDAIVYKKIFAGKDFSEQFNSYGGTALGLAHTLKQTAALRPRNQSKKLDNLFYVGANTTPGIGLPMCLVSAQLVYKRLIGDTSSASVDIVRPPEN